MSSEYRFDGGLSDEEACSGGLKKRDKQRGRGAYKLSPQSSKETDDTGELPLEKK
jgi:hypothetical protein